MAFSLDNVHLVYHPDSRAFLSLAPAILAQKDKRRLCSQGVGLQTYIKKRLCGINSVGVTKQSNE